MKMQFCFNDLSLKKKYFDLDVNPRVEDCFKSMAKILAAAIRYNNERPLLRTKNSLWGLEYDGQTLGKCEKSLDADTRKFIMQISDKTPYFDSTAVAPKYFYDADTAEGLGATFIYDAFSLSFPTATCWEQEKIQLTDEHDNAVTVLNIADEKSIESVISSYKKFEHRGQYMKDFSDLLDSNKTHFTNLKFSDRIDKQLDSLDKCFFSEVLKALCDIECLFSFYDVTPNKIKSLFPKCSGESETVRNNPKLKNERSFSFDGEQIECLEHIKFNDGLRIHYHANFKDKICYIGYIGSHLPTAKYKH